MRDDARKQSFAPYVPSAPTRLVLGSLPGDASLRAGQYYAHPRNAFWPLIAALAGVMLPAAYEGRLALLEHLGVALWDVCASAQRPGSLDQHITAPQANDIAGLLAAAPDITLIALNGGGATRLFQRLVLPGLSAAIRQRCRVITLPSSSPAAARLSFADKLAHWQELLEGSAAARQ